MLEGHSRAVNAVAFSLDGKLASASDDETVRLWTRPRGAALEVSVLSQALSFSIDGLCLETDRELLDLTSFC